MIELLETPTFVIDDFYDSKNIRFFDYLAHEDIPFEILELCSADLPYRDIVYYPVRLDHVTEDTNVFANVDFRALQKAQDGELTLVFIYDGFKDVVGFEQSLIRQLVEHQLSILDIRFITQIKPASVNCPFVYFSFAEMEAHIAAKDKEHVETINENLRENIATCIVTKDTGHARLYCGSMWYHALNKSNYFAYGEQDDHVLSTTVYKWNTHWQATATLMDMFGQQLPIADKEEDKLKFYNNAYWNLSIQPNFQSRGLSIGPQLFDPILNLQPFVIIGASFSVRLLQSLGYKTFGRYVNENYDSDADDESRMQSLFRLTYEMAYWTPAELSILSSKLHPILKHNQEHLLSSKRNKLISLLNTLKVGNQQHRVFIGN